MRFNTIMLSAAFALALALASPATAGTVLDMTFDNGAFTDSAGHVFTAAGTPTISSTTTDNGSAGALEIGPGVNYLTAAASPDFNLGSQDFTLSVSALFTSTITQWANAVNDWGNSASYQLSFITQTANTVTPAFIFTSSDGQHWLTSDITLSLNSWHDISASRSGDSFTLTVDGQTASTLTYGGSLNTANDPLWIGEPQCGYGYGACWDHGGTFYLDNISLSTSDPTAVPEPGALALLGGGLLAMAGFSRRSRVVGGGISAA